MENGPPKGIPNQPELITLGASGQNFEIWERILSILNFDEFCDRQKVGQQSAKVKMIGGGGEG